MILAFTKFFFLSDLDNNLDDEWSGKLKNDDMRQIS